MVHKTLIYLGADYDSSFPWGGYHITITGRNPHPISTLLTFLQSSKCSTDMFEIFDDCIGWKLTTDNIKGFEYDASVGSVLLYIACARLDRFHDVLKQFSADHTASVDTTGLEAACVTESHSSDDPQRVMPLNPPLQGLKHDWHITMQTKDLDAAKKQVQRWIDEEKIFRLFAVNWDTESSSAVWYKIDKTH